MTQKRKPRVLFLCSANSARSQLAQALLEHHAGDEYEVVSAGLEPGTLNPFTVRALEERGISAAHLHAKGVRPLIAEHFQFLITVCSNAEAKCPIFPNATYRLYWPFDDPAAVQGGDEERLAAFRAARDGIEARLLAWIAERRTVTRPPRP